MNQLHSQLRSLLSDCGLRTIAFLARHWDLASDTLLQLLTPLPQVRWRIRIGKGNVGSSKIMISIRENTDFFL